MVSPSSSVVQVTDKEVELDRPSATRSGEQATQPSVLSQMSRVRRAFLLVIFCFALFVDAFMTSGMIICLDSIRSDFDQSTSIVSWVLTAYSLTFGSFLLLAGRTSDIYHPKPVFIAGFYLIGFLGIGGGFVNNIIGLIVIRAFQGIGAAMTIPSATSMLTVAYPDPRSQGIALTFFAAAGTLGLCLGFVVGGIIVQLASWRWVVWIVPIITIPLSTISIFLIPGKNERTGRTDKKMDIPGVFVLTGSIILLIFSLSQAPDSGWGTAQVLAPLIISVLMMVAFFVWQTRLREEHALIPPKMWFIPSFLVYIFVSFCTQIYLTGPILVLSEYWPVSYGWTPITIGLHVLPMGITSTIVFVLLPRLILSLTPRIALIGANSMAALFSILMAFASSRDRYWSLTFPSMILITIGSSSAYMISNVGIITSVPSDKVGVAAAIFSAAQQVGGAINVAIITTILVEVQDKHPYPSYRGPSSAIWFMVALGVAQVLMVVTFLRPRAKVPPLSSDATDSKASQQRTKVQDH